MQVSICTTPGQAADSPESNTASMIPTPAIRIVEPTRDWWRLRLHELWSYRELIWILAWRDIAVRYKQTIVGALWAVVQPLGMVLIFSVIFRRWVHMPSQGVPYPLFAFVGLLPWQYFSAAMSGSSGSLFRSANILTKVSFPRLVIPIAGVIPPLVDFAIAFGVFMILLMVYGIEPTWRWIFLPVLGLMTLLLSLGVGIWASALSVEYRDFNHLLPFVTQLWMFASPIVYPPDVVSWNWRWLYVLNPMTGIIDAFRWVLLGTTSTVDCNIFLVGGMILVILGSGLMYFQHVEKTCADLI